MKSSDGAIHCYPPAEPVSADGGSNSDSDGGDGGEDDDPSRVRQPAAAGVRAANGAGSRHQLPAANVQCPAAPGVPNASNPVMPGARNGQ